MGAYCGTRYISSMSPGDACAGGGIATATKAGASEDTVTPDAVQYNQDSTPVQMGNESEAYYSAGRGGPAVPNMTKVYLAKEYFNKLSGLASIPDAKPADVKAFSDLVSSLRVYTNSKIGTRGAAETAWGVALKDASRAGVDVFDLIAGKAGKGPFGSGTGSVGAYKGPTSSVTLTSESSATAPLNALARDMIGRDLSDKELAKYTSALNKQEMANPDRVNPNGNNAIRSGGVDRAEVMRQVVADNPEYESFQMNHQVMDSLLGEIRKGQAVISGS